MTSFSAIENILFSYYENGVEGVMDSLRMWKEDDPEWYDEAMKCFFAATGRETIDVDKLTKQDCRAVVSYTINGYEEYDNNRYTNDAGCLFVMMECAMKSGDIESINMLLGKNVPYFHYRNNLINEIKKLKKKAKTDEKTRAIVEKLEENGIFDKVADHCSNMLNSEEKKLEEELYNEKKELEDNRSQLTPEEIKQKERMMNRWLVAPLEHIKNLKLQAAAIHSEKQNDIAKFNKSEVNIETEEEKLEKLKAERDVAAYRLYSHELDEIINNIKTKELEKRQNKLTSTTVSDSSTNIAKEINENQKKIEELREQKIKIEKNISRARRKYTKAAKKLNNFRTEKLNKEYQLKKLGEDLNNDACVKIGTKEFHLAVISNGKVKKLTKRDLCKIFNKKNIRTEEQIQNFFKSKVPSDALDQVAKQVYQFYKSYESLITTEENINSLDETMKELEKNQEKLSEHIKKHRIRQDLVDGDYRRARNEEKRLKKELEKNERVSFTNNLLTKREELSKAGKYRDY